MDVTLYDIAERFIGLREVAGGQDNPQILAMLKLDGDWPQHDEVPWCSAAVNYWAWLLRLPRSKRLNARSWLDVGRAVSVTAARPGFDVAVFWRRQQDSPWGHVGLWSGMIGDQVYVLGGNQSNGVSVAPFPVSRLLGVRRLA